MNITPETSGKPEWTLADFLSTYRYWALFLSSLLVGLGEQGLATVLPLISHAAGSSVTTVGIFYSGSTCGWILGAFLAFIVAGRSGLPALICPLVISAVFAAALVPLPMLWGSPVFLFLFGLAAGTVRTVFPLGVAIFLVSGRPGKIDFACALTLLSATALMWIVAPIGAGWLYQLSEDGMAVVAGFLISLLIAAAVLLPARRLAFDEKPRPRHRPLPPRLRPPVLVAAILLLPVILLLLLMAGIYLFQAANPDVSDLPPEIALILTVIVLIVAVGAFIYLAYWTYHIHGELAGVAPSQRLLTPLAAMLIAILVPLGLPVLLVTLGDLLNDRARQNGQRRPVSIAWLAIWILFLPPIAIAMIQHAANGSYARRSNPAGSQS